MVNTSNGSSSQLCKKPPLITYYELGLKPLMEMLKTVQILPIRHDLGSFKIKRHDLES